MALSIYDKFNRQYILNDSLNLEQINLPLVTERRERLSYPFGDAELVQIGFAGILIIYGDVSVKESRLRIKSFDEPESVELHFSIKGTGILENYLTNKKMAIKGNQHNIIYTPFFDGIAQFETDKSHQFFEVHFQRDKFIDLTSGSSTLLERFGNNIMNNRSVAISAENLPISMAMYACINDIMNCNFTGGLKLLFLQSKCVELLALQAQAFNLADQKTVSKTVMSSYDKDRIYYAREYLLDHASNPPSLTELAKVAGINEFKLKQGFKETFHNTVYGYLSDHKLMQARALLADKALDIKNISEQLGYSSVQHFSNAFSKKFGISPGKAR
ncbi:helix-turn-helix domain-containing protein [Pedobacter petrophilus]|uniref:Helix-turn-helix domain-containing protein n=1 Tax=Pedobacter petrophilus TaxID=1908241 RepID=A0A7K0FXZ3_9SPHI|nr:AraC family transcriptional regulator [Pedobacter petrophilus]MRX76395.1 helix-turn-helix domain-containing protein [Pedobacter petrophilus]